MMNLRPVWRGKGDRPQRPTTKYGIGKPSRLYDQACTRSESERVMTLSCRPDGAPTKTRE